MVFECLRLYSVTLNQPALVRVVVMVHIVSVNIDAAPVRITVGLLSGFSMRNEAESFTLIDSDFNWKIDPNRRFNMEE
jgi:hypothetical protein